MSAAGISAEQRRQEWRREQRRIARTCHPDLGPDAGADLDQYLLLMRELDLKFGFGPAARDGKQPLVTSGGSAAIVFRARPGAGWRRGIRRSGQALREMRTRLPRRMPGARRYVDL